MTATREVLVNGRWPLQLPEHRAARPEWPWWEATRLAAMHHHISPGDVVWDIGAEEGDFPALWSSWGAEVVLVEPNPLVWPNIRAIWEANELRLPALCWEGFVADQVTGTLTDHRFGDVWPASAYGPVIGDHGFCRVEERPDIPCITIDELVADGVPAPTVLTMDVEGAEHLVLRGASKTLQEHRPIVFVSIHDLFMDHHYGVAHGTDVIRAFMEAERYEEHYLCTDHEAHWMFTPA
jgi:FkbM family methyltransferase